jgi:hypothetical protein
LVFISGLQFRNMIAHCFMAYSFTSLSEPQGTTNLVTSLYQFFYLSAFDTSFHYRHVMWRLSLTKKPRALWNLGRASSGARGFPFGLTSEILYVSSGHLFSPLSPRFWSLCFLFLELSVVVSVRLGASLCATSSWATISLNWDNTSYSWKKVHTINYWLVHIDTNMKIMDV